MSLVTGAATGIGRATALRLAAAGYWVALVGRTRSTLDKTAQLVRDKHGADAATLVIPADVAEKSQPEAIADQVFRAWGRLDVLVNNAAMLGMAAVQDADLGALQKLFAVNVFAPIMLTARAWPIFERQRGGCVINISSASSIVPFPRLGLYGATKSALEGLTRAINIEGQSIGVRAFSIAPGSVNTAMLREAIGPGAIASENVLEADDVARVVMECIEGRRDAQRDSVIRLMKGD